MLYLELTEELKKKIEQITCTDYDFKGVFLPAHNADLLIRDLIIEIDSLNKHIEEMEQDIQQNFKKIKDDNFGVEE